MTTPNHHQHFKGKTKCPCGPMTRRKGKSRKQRKQVRETHVNRYPKEQ